MDPSNKYVRVDNPICGWGPTSKFSWSARHAGPIWSINTNGPIDLFWRNGSNLPTIKFPMFAAVSSLMKSIFDINSLN
jgi:hypothetical protein